MSRRIFRLEQFLHNFPNILEFLHSHDIRNNFVFDGQINDSQVKALHFCFQRLSSWIVVKFGDVHDVIPNVEPPKVEKIKACTT
jgi:hypothetical protein